MMAMLTFSSLQAQEVWSLENCIAYAYENNLQLQLNELNIANAKINEKQAKDNRLPNLNANIGYNINFAGAIDPTTYDFNSQLISNNSLGLGSQATVYQGGRLKRQIEKSNLDFKKALLDNEVNKNDISLAIASNYLSVLRAAEQLLVTKNQKDLSKEQKLNTEKLISAGLLPEGNLLELESQLVRDDLNIITAENAYDLALLNLKLLLDIEPETDIQLESPPQIEPSIALIESYKIEDIYNAALSSQPSIERANLETQIADKSLEIAETFKYPTLTVNGNLSSNFSSARKDNEFDFSEVESYLPLGIVGTDLTNIVNRPVFKTLSSKQTPYFTQLDDNFLQYIGANLSIPIFNQFQVKNQIEQAQLNIRSAAINQKIVTQNLNKEIRQAYADALAAGKTYEATQKSITSLQKSYEYAEKKFNLGVATSLELQTAQNALILIELQAKSNKYDYLFKLKVLDYYLGKPIKF